MGATGAVQFSEKCLRQEEGGVKVDGEIIFQAPLPPTGGGSTTTDVCANEGKEDDLLAEVQPHESPLNEETSSFLNVAAPEFVPESTPAEIKDDEEEEENVAASSSSDVSSSQPTHPHKHRHVNKHQPYHPYPMIPDYMVRGPFPSHLPLPYPYFLPRHPREPLIPLSVPFGYPYPPIHLQQSRMFPDGFPARHPHVYAAGMPSEIYMMDFPGPFPQDVQTRLYSWGGVPEQVAQSSPEPDHEAHDSQDDRDGTQEITSPNTNVNDTAEPRPHNNVTSSENNGNQFPIASLSSGNTSQFSTVIERSDSQLLNDASDDSDNISDVKTDFNEEIHPIKDNSTGQVVDTGYIHKHDSSHNNEMPSTAASKASLGNDSSSKSDLESSSEKAEVTELSQDSLPPDNTAQQDETYCTATATVNISDTAKQLLEDPENAQIVQTQHTVTEIIKVEPQPTITPTSVDNDNKMIPEEKLAAASPPVVTKKLPSTALGNKLNEPKIKPAVVVAGEPQQYKVDKKTSYSNSRTSNQFSSSRENNHFRTDPQTSTSSGKLSSKGSTKSGPSIILRAANPPEKKTYQQMTHTESASVNTSNREMSHSSSSSSTSVASQTEVKKTQSNSVSKETSSSSNSSNSNIQSHPQVEVKKSHTGPAWGQPKKWSQVFDNNTSLKDTSSPSKDPVVQSDLVSTTNGTVVEQTSTPPNPEHINKQLKSLGGKGVKNTVCSIRIF